MILKLNLTEDHLKLIPLFFIKDEKVNELPDLYNKDNEKPIVRDCCRIDKDHMYCLGSHLLEDISIALGLRDKAIEATKESADGLAFPDDVEKYMLDVHNYIVDNLYNIETLIHQFVIKGGITPGVYKTKDCEMIWERE
jgi:hypothetical protein